VVSYNKESNIKRMAQSRKARGKRRQVRRIIKLKDNRREREQRRQKSRIFNEIFKKIRTEEEATLVLSIYHKSLDLNLPDFLDSLIQSSPNHIQSYLRKHKKRYYDQLFRPNSDPSMLN
tara:strand:- start:323 stop:679 length:357 start_codon:yes stop_codon:yes gene_type:complete